MISISVPNGLNPWLLRKLFSIPVTPIVVSTKLRNQDAIRISIVIPVVRMVPVMAARSIVRLSLRFPGRQDE